ncbi:hypothetical protein [Geobacillus sp. LEMMY01]|uniref:hypothetical protein n=1 Tax=Geobacillus sp. LEMMY01 TaxID=1954237 RepID=UPI0009AE65C8|nr:hypothetical protein [Geobacillus sp. LEMMY01]OPX04969.1 hypothetical protein B1A75_01570 [Geobacillus sp. LEMMY01]
MYILTREGDAQEKALVLAAYHKDTPLPPGHQFIEFENYEQPPIPETRFGKEPVLYANLVTKELFYEYIDRSLTQDEELQQLKERQALMQQALDDLLLGGMQ